MSDIALVLLGAGSSTRFGLQAKKQWLWIGDKPLWLFVAERLTSIVEAADTIITAHPEEVPFFRRYCDYRVVAGGASRQESIAHALEHVKAPYVLISDIARVCIQPDVVSRIFQAMDADVDCIAPYIPSPDTVVYKNETLDRSQVKLIQTPQLSRTDTLRQALASGGEFTDESSAIRAIGGNVIYIEGDIRQRKLTYKEDLAHLSCLEPPTKKSLVGLGFDVHAFCEDRPLMLCGVEVPHEKGLAGHSDADVAIHALIDALLGAAGFGDIGELFPDSDAAYAGIDSRLLLQRVHKLLLSCGFEIASVDITILAQAPKLAPHKAAMQSTVAKILNLPKRFVNIKATTTEKLGFVGRKEGIAAQAVATLHYYDWSSV